MLSPDDADLVRRDPALADLATLLDPEAAAGLFGVPCAEVVYVRYKPYPRYPR